MKITKINLYPTPSIKPTVKAKPSSPVVAKTSTVTRSPSKSVVISLKGSKNTRVNLHSSPLLGFLGMQLLAIGLFLGKKLPLLGMIGKILHYYLGKTSI